MFSGSEIVEIGIQIEVNGRDFYEALILKSASEKAKEIFKFLAGEEEDHIDVFKEILSSVKAYDPPESYPVEYFEYMRALASQHVFTKAHKGKETAEQIKDDKEALDIAIGFEKDSIEFYEAMKKIVLTKDHPLLNALIVQEHTHLNRLSELKKTL
ncbi:MAG: ferritin family protein [bacterium]